MPCQELGRLRGRAAQTSRCQIWWSRSLMLDILQASDLDQMCHCGNCDLLTGSYCKSVSSAQCAWVIWLCLKMIISSSTFWNPLSFVLVKIPHISICLSFNIHWFPTRIAHFQSFLHLYLGLFHTYIHVSCPVMEAFCLSAKVDCTLLGSPSFISRVLVGALTSLDLESRWLEPENHIWLSQWPNLYCKHF